MDEALDIQDLEKNLLNSFSACCALMALHVALEGKSEVYQTEMKKAVIASWKEGWDIKFQEELKRYNGDIQGLSESEFAGHPEEIQLKFNKAFKKIEKQVSLALFGGSK